MDSKAEPGAAGRQQEPSSDPVVLAIERVLQAERAGEARLRDCRREAEAIVASAREQAASIARRVDARIVKLHAAYLSKISAEIANLPIPRAAACETVDDADLARAGRRLAAKLTGGS
jgi:hypothetical protein